MPGFSSLAKFIGAMTRELAIYIIPEPLISRYLNNKRDFALDKNNDFTQRQIAIRLLKHRDYIPALITIASDPQDTYFPRSMAIIMLHYKEPKNNQDYRTIKDNERRGKGLLGVINNKNDDSTIRIEAIEHIDYRDRHNVKHLLPIIMDKTDDKYTRIAAISHSILTSGDSSYDEFIIPVICISEDSSEEPEIRRRAMRALDKEKHKDILWALKNDPDESIRHAATTILHSC